MRRRAQRWLFGVAAAAAWLSPSSALASGTVTITSIQSFSAVEGTQSVPALQAIFTDTNAVSPSNHLTVLINWGDGTGNDTSSAQVVEVGGAGGTTYTIAANHTFPEEGFFNVSLSVTETANPANTATTTTTTTTTDAPLASPFGTPSTFSAAGSAPTTSSLAAFQAAIGGRDNGTTAGEQSGGFRHINWDGIALDGSDPGSTVISSGHVVALSATRVQNTGLTLQGAAAVANDGFASVNPNVTSPTRFPAFSSANVVAPFNNAPLDLRIVTPASASSSPTTQGTRGVGLVFLNVRIPNTTSVDYFNGDAELLKVFAPASGAPGQPSFVGVLFPTAVVTRVVVTLGTAQIFSFDGTTATAGPTDNPPSSNLVAVDDVVLAEPAAPDPNISGVAGLQFSGVVSSFMDADPNGTARDYRAAVDWGDGNRSSGTVALGTAGNFTVSASHTYAQPGSYAVEVTVNDLGGAGRATEFTARVSPRSTATSASCVPASVSVLQTTICTATVSDTQVGTTSAPTGTVAFTSDSSGGFSSGACTLSPTAVPGQSSCLATYSPNAVGSGTHRISAVYGGDAVHTGSVGSTPVKVTAGPASTVTPECSISVPSMTLGKHAKRFDVKVRCSAPANVRLTAVASVSPRHARHTSRLDFGAASMTVGANKTKTLTLKPSAKVLRKVRAAAKNHAKISLALSLKAVNTAAQSAATSVRTLKVRS